MDDICECNSTMYIYESLQSINTIIIIQLQLKKKIQKSTRRFQLHFSVGREDQSHYMPGMYGCAQ